MTSLTAARPAFRPEQVQILLTERCNLRCRHCAVPEEDSPATHELDLRSWQLFIRQCVEDGLRSLVFSGGEALLRADAVKLAAFAHEAGAERTTLVTNGLLFRGDIPGQIAAAQAEHQAFGVHVSIDGASPLTHDWMRGQGTFRRTMRAIDRLHAAGGRITGLHTVLHRGNAHEIAGCADLAEHLGAEVWTVFPVAELGRARDIRDARLDESAWRSVIDQVTEVSRRRPFTVSVMGPVYGDEWPAGAGEVPNPRAEHALQACVGPDGLVFCCPPLRGQPVGSVAEVSGSGQWRKLADRAGEQLLANCGTCKFLLLCTGLDLSRPYRPRGEDRPRAMPPLAAAS
ncbi:MAG TPA: radical SAM protein [Streptosporangiaceae bacterium]|nr:radical SAM protein [Streptosporangiaceae bacterium]